MCECVCVRACVCVHGRVCVISPSLSVVSTARDCSYSQGSISQRSCDLTEKLHTGGNTYIGTFSYYVQQNFVIVFVPIVESALTIITYLHYSRL